MRVTETITSHVQMCLHTLSDVVSEFKMEKWNYWIQEIIPLCPEMNAHLHLYRSQQACLYKRLSPSCPFQGHPLGHQTTQ